MAKITGQVVVKGFARIRLRIKDLTEEGANAIRKEVINTAHDIRNTIINSMEATPKTGNVYRGGRGGRIHIASSPFNPPAKDFGELIRSITVDDGHSRKIEVGAESGAPYAEYLERGTDKMKKRPFLLPAKEEHLPGLEERIKQAIMRTAR